MGIGGLRTGIFNVADVAILAGIGVLIVDGWIQDRHQKRAALAKAAEGASVESAPS